MIATPEIGLNSLPVAAPDVNVIGAVDNLLLRILVATVEGDAVVALIREVATLGLLCALLGSRGDTHSHGG